VLSQALAVPAEDVPSATELATEAEHERS
jgi:hypothetical protein